METLPKDILVEITLKLELPDVLNLCFSKKIFNQKIFENYIFWSKMLKKDFDINYNKNNSRDIYKEVNVKFKNAIKSIFDEGYPSKLRKHLIKSGYINEFKKEISQYLGPYYEKTADYCYIGEIYTIIEKYFFDGGYNNGYYPLKDIEYTFLNVFNIEEEDTGI